MSGDPKSRAVSKAGFALPSVLFVAAMVSLVFLVAIQALGSLAEETRRTKAGADFEAAALTLEARATFIAATAPVGPSGLLQSNAAKAPMVLTLDGAPYAVSQDLSLSAQDEAGLINLDNLAAPAKARLVAALGVAPVLQPTVLARLSDYMDPTASRRPQGADASDYARQNLPPPPTGPLRSAVQILGVMGLRQAMPAATWRSLRDDITADPSSLVTNVNTTTPVAMAVLYGMDGRQVAQVLAARAQAPFTDLEDLGRAAGVTLHGDNELIFSMPSGRVALKIADWRDGLVYRSRLFLSPQDETRPFWVVEPNLSSQIEAEKKATPPSNAPRFPDPAA